MEIDLPIYKKSTDSTKRGTEQVCIQFLTFITINFQESPFADSAYLKWRLQHHLKLTQKLRYLAGVAGSFSVLLGTLLHIHLRLIKLPDTKPSQEIGVRVLHFSWANLLPGLMQTLLRESYPVQGVKRPLDQ
jgi:hypothetical protein